jgi:hypothetical protein
MVAEAAAVEVRAVGAAEFDDILPLLLSFGNRKMSRDDWHRMLFSYDWWPGKERGFAIYSRGQAVGFLGTIFSKRRIEGREQVVCNTSSWIVREEFRGASIALLKPVLAMRDCTIVNLTPTLRSYEIFAKLGFKPLESELLVLPPLADIRSIAGGSFSSDSTSISARLDPEEREIHEALATSPRAHRILLRRGVGSCYIVATVRRIKRVPFAEIHYVGNRDFFWKNRALAHAAALSVMGAPGLAIDRRFAPEKVPGYALRLPAKRLFRPADPATPAAAVDGLFSEMITLKI